MLEDLKLSPRYDGFIFLAEARRNPPILKPHCHVELELNLVVEGSISYVVAGQRHVFHRGSLLWIFPAQEHQLVDRTPDASYYVAVFKPGLIRRVCKGAKYDDLKKDSAGADGVLSRSLDPASFAALQQTMASLMEDGLDADLLNRQAGFGFRTSFRFEHGDPDALNAGLHYLLIFCWRHYLAGAHAGEPVRLHPGIRKALRLLGEVDNRHSVRQLATVCGLSETYLSRLFLQQVGVSIAQYRNATRLSHFMERYREPAHRTVLETVYEAGFGSYAQFFKVFHQAYGRGPRAYLAEARRHISASVESSGLDRGQTLQSPAR